MIIEDLNINSQLNLIDIYVTHQPTNAEVIFFPSATIIIDNIPDKNTNHNKLRRGKSDKAYPHHNKIKVETNNRNISGKPQESRKQKGF